MVRVRYLPLSDYDVASLRPFEAMLRQLKLKVRPFHEDYDDLAAILQALDRLSVRAIGEPMRLPLRGHVTPGE